MSTPLLSTKLYIPPVQPGLVPRPRLLVRLNGGLNHKLTLISAPAGFGKTTLLSEWIAEQERVDHPVRVAWLSLDEGDNDLTRFLTYSVAALQYVEVNIVQGILSALQAPGDVDIEIVMTTLLNDVADFSNEVVLVLDDYHVIESQPIDRALTFLLNHLPANLHLVIATREDPNLPVARLRALGQLTELRATDLRFTFSEISDFLNQRLGQNLSAEDIAALEFRTEGWIAGLQLAAISMQRQKDASSFIRSFTGSHRFVLDYLIEEVLEQQPEHIQTFLLQTAILNRLTGSLCDALTGLDNGQETLEILERANLFIIPRDEERCWYRYHHLFAELLRQRLKQTQPERLPILHCAASEWYEQNGFIDEAIEHGLQAEAFERVATLLEEHVDGIWKRGEHTKLRRWMVALPAELVFSKPHLCILHAWDMFTSGQQHAAEQSLQIAEQALASGNSQMSEALLIDPDQPSGSDKMMLSGRVSAIRAFLASYSGDVPGTIKYSRLALDYLPAQDLTWRSTATVALGDAYSFTGELAAAYKVRLDALEASKAAGNIYMFLIASMKLAVTLRQQGQLLRVIELCEQQMDVAKEYGLSQTVVIGWLLAIWGEVLAELNDLDGALQHARKGASLTERGRDVAMIGWSNLCLMRVLFTMGDISGTQDTIRYMETIDRESHVPPWILNLMAAWQVRLWLVQDRLEAVSLWVEERGLDIDTEPAYLRDSEYMVFARFLIAQGRCEEATRLLQRLLRTAETAGHTSRVIEVLMLQALVFQAVGDTARAMTPLGRALSVAGPCGFLRIFVDEGPPMARLLYRTLSRGIEPEYVSRLLAAFPVAEREQTGPSISHTPNADLIEPLSEREIEVLQLIGNGLTNREIATSLYLSLNTVKVHTRNIYGKLSAHNRTQAIAKARALRILPFS